MKRFSLIILCLLLIPNSLAWGWKTHQNLVENVYDSFPRELQSKLNITLIREGSIAPDKVFRDNVLHHYPPAYKLALKWFNVSKESFYNNNYDNASYAFGVMSHYITDSFVAPHYIRKEDPKLHSEFERQVSNYIPKIKCEKVDYDLNRSLDEASKHKEDWEPWLMSKDKLIPEQAAEEAEKLLYSVSLDLFNTNCVEKTKIINTKFSVSNGFMIVAFVIGIMIFILLIYLFKN